MPKKTNRRKETQAAKRKDAADEMARKNKKWPGTRKVSTVARTISAVMFHTGDKSEAVWLPRSQIEIEETGVAGIVTITLPEWLALDKGLI